MWITGPELPYKVGEISNAMFTSPNGGGVIIAGGYNGDSQEESSDIIEFRSDTQNWTILEQTLNQPRYGHVIIPLP